MVKQILEFIMKEHNDVEDADDNVNIIYIQSIEYNKEIP